MSEERGDTTEEQVEQATEETPEHLKDTTPVPDAYRDMFRPHQHTASDDEGDEGAEAIEGDEGVSPEGSEKVASDEGAAEDTGDQEPSKEELIRQRDGIIAELRERRQREKQVMAELEQLRSRIDSGPSDDPQQAQDGMPDPESQPVEYLKWYQDQKASGLEEKLTALEQRLEQENQQRQRQELTQRIYHKVTQDEEEFRKQAPDVDQAVSFLGESAERKLIEAGYDLVTAREMRDRMQAELLLEALKAGKNVPQHFYEEAKKWGYSGPKNKGGNNRTAPAAPRKRAEASLSTVGGGAASGGPDSGRKITVDEYRLLPPGDPMRMKIAGNSDLMRKLAENGEIYLT